MSPPRILTLAAEYPPAPAYGAARCCQELSAALAAAGADVHIVTLNYRGGEPDSTVEGVHVYRAVDVDNPAHYDALSATVTDNIWLIERAQQVAREQGPFDLLTVHGWQGVLAAKALKVIHDLPLVLFMHATEPGRRGRKLGTDGLYAAQTETWACEHADAVVVPSESLAEEVRRVHRVPEKKIAVASPGVNSGRFETDCHLPDFRALLAQPGMRLVLFAGRLTPDNGPDLLLQAMPEVLRKCPRTRLVLAGDGGLRRGLERLAAELGVSDHVRFAGHISGKVLGAAYRAADLVVVPSRYAPFSLVALEAMSCGTPVAAADVGELRKLVHSAGATRRFGAGSAEALATSLHALLARDVTEADREALRASAAARTWEGTARTVLDVCGQVLAARGVPA